MSIRISQIKYHSISVDHARYATYIVAKYLDNATFTISTKFYNNTFPSDMIFTETDASTSDKKVEKLKREFNIHYRARIGSLIYLLSTRVDLSFAVHKLAKCLCNPCRVYFEVLVHLLRYIRDNKNFGLQYYADIKDSYLSDLFIQCNINTGNQLISFSNYSWKDFTDTGRSTGE